MGAGAHGGSAPPVLVIAVISNNRLHSLRRLCSSLLRADYSNAGGAPGPGVPMPPLDARLVFNLEASSSNELLDFVYSFRWPHGTKTVKRRVRQGGLITAVAESWYPSSDGEYGLLLEDDIEVSPLYMVWIKLMLHKYRSEGSDTRLIGISLYSPRLTETTNPRRDFDSAAITCEKDP